MARIYILFIFCFIFGCNTSKTDSEQEVQSTNHLNQKELSDSIDETNKTKRIRKDQIIGQWTDEYSENATMDISIDSIFYIENFESYSYAFQNDSITIFYPDMIFKGHVYFNGDTLIFNSREYGISKFLRFTK